jgi:hypothetical protein
MLVLLLIAIPINIVMRVTIDRVLDWWSDLLDSLIKCVATF